MDEGRYARAGDDDRAEAAGGGAAQEEEEGGCTRWNRRGSWSINRRGMRSRGTQPPSSRSLSQATSSSARLY